MLDYESVIVGFICALPVVFIISVGLHFLWRIVSNGRIRDDDDFL
jgi:hypothetical protein